MAFHLILYWTHIVLTIIGLGFNMTLLILIKYHTRPEMHQYRRILYQNCFIEILYAVISGVSQTNVETYGSIILITPPGVPSATRPQANIITTFWVCSLYSVSLCVPVQYFYRYLILVRGTTVTRSMYALMLLPSGIMVFLISAGYYWTVSTIPNCTNEILALLKFSNDGHDVACVPLMLSHPGMKFILSVAFIGMTMCAICVPLLNYLVYRNLRDKVSMSSSEKSVQRQVSITLIAQICVIGFTSLAPLGFILINIALTTTLPWLSTLASTTFSVLPVVNPLMTIYVIRSYRRKALFVISTLLNRKTQIFSLKGTTT